jgi:hypothetical protein
MKYFTIAYLAGASAASAHSGHPEAAAGQAHWLTQGDHAVILILGGALVALGVGRWSFKRLRAARE